MIDTNEAIKLRAILEEIKRPENYDPKAKDYDYDETTKPAHVTALPMIKKRFKPMKPLPGVSYLATSGMYEDLMSRKNQ